MMTSSNAPSSVAVSGGAIPRHVAIIMDGNGRWAEARGLPRFAGHTAGVEAVRRTVRAAIEIKVQYLTIYSFSTENWTRPEPEVKFLMSLMRRFIRSDLAELHKNGVRICLIGERDRVDVDLLALMDEAVEITRSNNALTLIIAFNYGGRGEIAKAARVLAAEVIDGRLALGDITPDALSANLDTAAFPDPDLLIRTSGEQRLSNFLLWQLAYAEFLFLDVLWPDFDKAHLERAVASYGMRDRRFGGLTVIEGPPREAAGLT
jgi:undecaprenyl diphosphate synthase